MKKVIALLLILSLAVFLMLSAGGCFKAGRRISEAVSEQAIEQAIEKGIEEEGGDAEVDISEGQVSIKTDEGETSWGTGTEIPENLPEVVPIYPDMTPISSMSGQDDGKEFYLVGFESSDPGEKIYNWYGDEFSAGGWQIEFEASTANNGYKTYQLSVSNGTYFVSVVIAEESGGVTSISLNVSSK